jgi:hypothetical protein
MNSMQPFGTRDFASGRWGQCGGHSLREILEQLIQKYGWREFLATLHILLVEHRRNN